MVALFHDMARLFSGKDAFRPEEFLDVMEPEECDECLRRTFVPMGYDDSGGTATVGLCVACGYRRSEQAAWDLYVAQEWALRWQHD